QCSRRCADGLRARFRDLTSQRSLVRSGFVGSRIEFARRASRPKTPAFRGLFLWSGPPAGERVILPAATLVRKPTAHGKNGLRSGITHTNMLGSVTPLILTERASGGAMTDTVHVTAPAAAGVSDAYRWTQLAIGVGA